MEKIKGAREMSKIAKEIQKKQSVIKRICFLDGDNLCIIGKDCERAI